MTNREIDAAIAEKVMGWLKFKSQRRQCSVADVDWDFEWISPQNAHEITNGGNTHSLIAAWAAKLPAYSTDPVASKALREELAERRDTNLAKGNVHAFALWPKGTSSSTMPPSFLAIAETEELAVCLCALKAYGIERGA